MELLLVHRWPDRAAVVASAFERRAPQQGIGVTEVVCRLGVTLPRERRRVYLYPEVHEGRQIVTTSGHDQADLMEGPFREKLLGFLSALGVDRPRPDSRGLVAERGSGKIYRRTQLPCPRFVDDDLFARRYEEATVGYPRRSFLGCVERFRITSPPGSGLFQASWRGEEENALKKSDLWSSVEHLVDQVVAEEDLRPASARASFLERETDPGELLALSPDELEVYRLLGEPPPFFWKGEELVAWLEERATP